MSKVNDYNEKCLDELFTELDEQEELKQMKYDKTIEALSIVRDYLNEQATPYDRDWETFFIVIIYF